MNHFNFCRATLLFLSLLISVKGSSQLTVSANKTAAVLASTIAGPGITVSSPSLTCTGQANGTFTVSPGTILGTGATAFGIGSGILLTTGKSTAAAGLESTLASTNNGAAGDPALSTLALTTTLFDGCYLEFDFTALGNSISFNYIFGSEEYNHSTCGPYNDAFAFFISGPGITGTQNMALVPGTTIPVTVNSVNSGVPGAGYTLANCTAMGVGSPFPAYFTDNTGGTNFTYKGFTTVLTASSTVTPCSTYHLKMSITDAGNSIYDSGVFIEAGSLTTTTITPRSVCVGGNTTFTSPIAGGTWSSSNTAIAIVGSGSGIVTGMSTGSATISYTISTGCSLTTTVTVSPLAPITGNTTLCSNGTTTLSNTATGGTWSSNNTAVATVNTNTGLVTGVSAGTAVITYALPTGCSTTNTVIVNPAPSPMIGASSICTGHTIALSDATAGGTWASSNTNIATVTPSGIVSGISSGIATITYTIANGCFLTTPVNVNPLAPITGSPILCSNGEIVLSNSTTGGTWSSSNTSIATIDAIGQVTGISPGVVTIVYTVASGCITSATLTVNPAPDTIAGQATVCRNNSLQLSDATAGGTWSINNPGIAAISPTGIVTGVTGGSTLITYTLPDGCFVLMPFLVPSVDATILTPDTTICIGSSVTIRVLASTALNYLWYPTTGVDNPNIMQPTITPSLTTTYYMIATATGNTCSDTGKITINVESVFVVAGPGMSVCMGEQIILNAGPSATNYSFNWNGPSGYNSGLQDPVISSANIADQGVYTVTLTDNTTGCYSQDTTQISVVTSATLTNVTPNQTIKYGSTVQLNADNVLYYWWTPADGSISNPNINNPLAAPTVSTTYIVYGMDANGCRDTASVTIDVTNDTLFIPSAFTPNGDGLNDVFRVGNLGHYKVVEMSIYNRWGTMIYHVNDGSNRGWDGTYNGVPQETGVFYYYVIISQPDGIQRSFKGDVTLIR